MRWLVDYELWAMLAAGVFWSNYIIFNLGDNSTVSTLYTLLDTRMVEHTTDYSTDVIKMTVYSASWAAIIICKSCNKMHTPGIYCLEKY